eukprot:9388496-Karenia_brevis.AAC.1
MVAEQVNASSSQTVQPASGSSPDQAGDLEAKMIKMVSITVKEIMSEMIPHLLKFQQDERKTVD